MKKVVFCLALFALLLSCEGNNWSDTVITNSSEFEVKFKFNHTSEFTLPAGSTRTFETKAYQYLASYSDAKRVSFKFESTDEGYTGEFITLPSRTLIVTNTLDKKVTLSADGWMDETEIPAENDPDFDIKIYTENPVFKATVVDGDYLAAVTWEIKDDSTMLVRID
jgi:hypothetical protein